MVGKAYLGAPLLLLAVANTMITVTAMTNAPSYIQMKTLSYIGHMMKKQKLFAIRTVSTSLLFTEVEKGPKIGGGALTQSLKIIEIWKRYTPYNV